MGTTHYKRVVYFVGTTHYKRVVHFVGTTHWKRAAYSADAHEKFRGHALHMVEVPGIEPGSFDTDTGLLRA